MQLKTRIIVVMSLLVVVIISIVTKPSSKGLELSECNLDAVATTHVHFFVDEEVLASSTLDEVKKSMSQSVKYANQVLENSCIPLQRRIGKISAISLDKNSVNNLSSAWKIVKKSLESSGTTFSDAYMSELYGLIFHKRHVKILGLSGQASPYFGNGFFAISSGAPIHALEHELGHLSWAQHRESNPIPNLTLFLKSAIPQEYQGKLVSYARAFRCGDSGTIMSYEAKILPIYSSPLVKYQDNVCGDIDNGDNARVLREFALELLKQEKAQEPKT
ncbi:hypothetical protein AB4168_23515 [Vibrio splendidus]